MTRGIAEVFGERISAMRAFPPFLTPPAKLVGTPIAKYAKDGTLKILW